MNIEQIEERLTRIEERLEFLLDHCYNCPKNWRERLKEKDEAEGLPSEAKDVVG